MTRRRKRKQGAKHYCFVITVCLFRQSVGLRYLMQIRENAGQKKHVNDVQKIPADLKKTKTVILQHLYRRNSRVAPFAVALVFGRIKVASIAHCLRLCLTCLMVRRAPSAKCSHFHL